MKIIKGESPRSLKEGETIRCSVAVAKTCVYGSTKKENGLCNYCAVVGHSRSLGKDGCSWQECTKYSKITKDNPRRSIWEE